MSATDPFLGTPYRVVQRLHVRRLTEIYKVDAPGGPYLAKILSPNFVEFPEAADRLRLEADILGALDHPHIVRLHAAGRTSDGRPYLILERLAGRTLRRELVRQSGPLPVATAVEYVQEALDGVA